MQSFNVNKFSVDKGSLLFLYCLHSELIYDAHTVHTYVVQQHAWIWEFFKKKRKWNVISWWMLADRLQHRLRKEANSRGRRRCQSDQRKPSFTFAFLSEHMENEDLMNQNLSVVMGAKWTRGSGSWSLIKMLPLLNNWDTNPFWSQGSTCTEIWLLILLNIYLLSPVKHQKAVMY